MNIAALPQPRDVNDSKVNEFITQSKSQNTKVSMKVIDMRKQHDLSIFSMFSVMA